MPWLTLAPCLVAIHVMANVVWIGSIVSVAYLVAIAPTTPHPIEVGALARRLYLRLAAPAFGVSFLAGIVRMSMAIAAYMQLHWMHGKLTFALAVIGLHHVIGGRAKRLARGEPGAERGAWGFVAAVLVCAFAAVFFVVVRP